VVPRRDHRRAPKRRRRTPAAREVHSESGTLAVEGGIEGEALHPLDFSPLPGRPLRGLLPPETITTDLARLAALQQDDGGWIVDFTSQTVAGALEWRGYATASAVKILLAD
jgi:hypothetical protein